MEHCDSLTDQCHCEWFVNMSMAYDVHTKLSKLSCFTDNLISEYLCQLCLPLYQPCLVPSHNT